MHPSTKGHTFWTLAHQHLTYNNLVDYPECNSDNLLVITIHARLGFFQNQAANQITKTIKGLTYLNLEIIINQFLQKDTQFKKKNENLAQRSELYLQIEPYAQHIQERDLLEFNCFTRVVPKIKILFQFN